MIDTQRPTPDKLMQIITGGWAAAVLGAAARHKLFDALEPEGAESAAVARKSDISARGAQALLDGLTGLGVLERRGERYYNTPEASAFLLSRSPANFGGMAQVMTHALRDWATLPDAAASGQPTATETNDIPDNAFWHILVTAIAPISVPVATLIAERLGLARAGEVSWLDVGGGSGVWSAVWLQSNPQARAVQLDWPQVNRIARQYVGQFGVAERLQTIDGDLHTADFGESRYDYGIYSHIAHQESAGNNVAVFRKFRRALRPGGTLVINDFVLEDDHSGHPFAMLFSAQMLLASREGRAWCRSDYQRWLQEAGFGTVEFVTTATPATVVLAR
jgi:SAM-dependent methyltransferase